jgi:hypothetical protein
MPAAKKPHLVSVDSLPKTVHKSVYVSLVEQFAKGKATVARIEGVKPSAAVSLKNAIDKLGAVGVSVVTRNGEIYLTK